MEWNIDPAHEGMSIRDYLREVQAFSRGLLVSVKHEGGSIRVNGEEERVSYQLVAGDILSVEFPAETVSKSLRAEEMALEIVYEDEWLIVVNKPARMAVVPSPQHRSGTLANGLLAHYGKAAERTGTIHIVTRLDADTSGLVLAAKNRYSHSLLAAQQKMGAVKRRYTAITEGIPEKEKGTIEAPIGRKDGSIIERAVTPEGKRAVTHYETIGRIEGHAILQVELETGRTHQIRVHLSHIGHPLAGDDLYGGALSLLQRQALHCTEISFLHPVTKEAIHLRAAFPDDWEGLVTLPES